MSLWYKTKNVLKIAALCAVAYYAGRSCNSAVYGATTEQGDLEGIVDESDRRAVREVGGQALR